MHSPGSINGCHGTPGNAPPSTFHWVSSSPRTSGRMKRFSAGCLAIPSGRMWKKMSLKQKKLLKHLSTSVYQQLPHFFFVFHQLPCFVASTRTEAKSNLMRCPPEGLARCQSLAFAFCAATWGKFTTFDVTTCSCLIRLFVSKRNKLEKIWEKKTSGKFCSHFFSHFHLRIKNPWISLQYSLECFKAKHLESYHDESKHHLRRPNLGRQHVQLTESWIKY